MIYLYSKFPVAFSWKDSCLCIWYLVVSSNFNLLHNTQLITILTHSCQVCFICLLWDQAFHRFLHYIVNIIIIYKLYLYTELVIGWYERHKISFPIFFIWVFKIVVDSWKFTILFLYILWDDWLIFIISGSSEQLQQQLEYTLLIVTAGEFQKCNQTP